MTDVPDFSCTSIPCTTVDLVVIGGGPAGMAAAVEARKQGVQNILILEREPSLGGILNQCIHDGFGLEIFREALTGPEYMRRYLLQVEEHGIHKLTDCMVLEITHDREIIASTPAGLQTIRAGAIVLAMGCRERSRGAIRIPGTRPAGVYTAGTAQHFINLKNLMVGQKIVILGSGDIGMIMARRLTLEGAEVLAVVEILPHSSGLQRNVVQCLQDYSIPLHLSHTVTDILGKERVEAVEISEVDSKFQPIPGTNRIIECDTLLLSVGLIPENELSKTAGVELDIITGGAVVDESLQTSVPGIFACGNVLHVHDVVDWATLEAERAGRSAAQFLSRGKESEASDSHSLPGPATIPMSAGDGIHYVVPQKVKPSGLENEVILSFRVRKPGPDVTIALVASTGDTIHERVVHEKTLKRVNPAEMIQFKLKPGALESFEGADSFEVRINPVKGGGEE